MGTIGHLLNHGSKPLLVVFGLLYAGGAVAAWLKPDAGKNLRWDNTNAAHGLQNVLVWTGVKVYRVLSRAIRWALDTLQEASADVGDWFTGNRGAHV